MTQVLTRRSNAKLAMGGSSARFPSKEVKKNVVFENPQLSGVTASNRPNERPRKESGNGLDISAQPARCDFV